MRFNYKDVFFGFACACIYEAVCGQVNPIQVPVCVMYLMYDFIKGIPV